MAEEQSSGGINVGLVAVLVLAYAGGQWMLLTAIDTKLQALEQRIVDSAAHVQSDVSAVEQKVAMAKTGAAAPAAAVGAAEGAAGAAAGTTEPPEQPPAAPAKAAAPAAPAPAAPAPKPAAPAAPAAPAPAAPAQ